MSIVFSESSHVLLLLFEE